MKRFFAIIFFSLFTAVFVNAQCSIDYTYYPVGVNYGLHPDTLPDGVVGQFYNQDLTFYLPLDTVSMLALGDSYTIGQSVDSIDRWPVQLIDTLQLKGRVIHEFEIRAVTGWTTSALLLSLKNKIIKPRYNIVSLLIGVNNYYQGLPEAIYIKEFQELLDSATGYCTLGKKGVFAVSIPDYGYTPFGENDQYRISKLTDRYNFIGDSISQANGIEFINITDISRTWTTNADLVATDQLHPSGKQYSLWVSRMLNNNFLTSKTRLDYRTVIPARQLSKRVWIFNQTLQLNIFTLNGQLVFRKTVNNGEVVDLTKIKGNIMIMNSKTESWSVSLY